VNGITKNELGGAERVFAETHIGISELSHNEKVVWRLIEEIHARQLSTLCVGERLTALPPPRIGWVLNFSKVSIHSWEHGRAQRALEVGKGFARNVFYVNVPPSIEKNKGPIRIGARTNDPSALDVAVVHPPLSLSLPQSALTLPLSSYRMLSNLDSSD